MNDHDPIDPIDPIDRIAELVEDGDYEGALDALGRSSAQDNASLGRAQALEMLARQGLGDEAGLEALRGQIAVKTRERAFALAYAGELCAMDAADQAASVLEGLLDDEDADDAHLPWFFLGLARQASGDDPGAIDAFDSALELNMAFEDAMLARAESQQALGDLEGEACSLELYAEADPDDRTRWIDLAVCHGRRGDVQAANSAFEHAAEAPAIDEEDDIALYYAWAQVARLLDDGDRLTRAIKKLIAEAPEDPRTLLARGFAADRQGLAKPGWNMFEQAFDAAAEALDLVLLNYTAECAFEFVDKHGLIEEQAQLVEMVFDEGVFSELVLEHVRRLGGAAEADAIDFSVAVRGTLPADEEEGTAAAPYVRWMSVWATDAPQAGSLACALETQAGGEQVVVEAIEAGEPGGVQRLGVWWISPDRALEA